jgi:hypothetical protein
MYGLCGTRLKKDFFSSANNRDSTVCRKELREQNTTIIVEVDGMFGQFVLL